LLVVAEVKMHQPVKELAAVVREDTERRLA
jgi:hypothetical protein